MKEADVEEAMSDQQMKDIEKYGQEDKVVKNFKPGDMFSTDFDYEGMLEFGLKVRLNTPIETLKALFNSFEDVNYHSEGSHLSYAIDSIEERDKVEALDHLRNFKKAIKNTLVSFNEGADPTREIAEGVVKERTFKSKTYGKLAEGRRKKTKGGKVVTENDYETGGYVESMGPLFDKGVNFLIKAWEEWKMGPMTEPGMIEFAKKDILSYLETQFMVENLEEKKGKDLDGDGDVDGDDYKHAKDKAIKKAMGKDEIVKENIKSIITKVLEEQVINEAATNELAKFADQYGSFEGMKQAVIQLQDVVTDIESYYDKTRGKIQKVYDTLGDIRNEEGLKVGGFLAPSIESAFNKDLRPVTKSGFTKGLETPKVKVLSKRDIDRHDVGVPNIGEDEKQTVYSAPLNGTLRETKLNVTANELFGMGGSTKLKSLQPFTIEFAAQDTLELVMKSQNFATNDKGERVKFNQDTVVVGKPLQFDLGMKSLRGGMSNVTKITSLGKDIKKLNVKDLEKGQYRVEH